jgi:CRISPR-associated protein (Cas_Cas02710)
MSRKSISTGLQLLTTPQTIGTFLIGGIALGVLGNAVYQLLTNWLTASNYAAIRIITGAFLTLISVAWFLSRLTHKLQSTPPLPNKKRPEKRKGIIFLVSNEPTIRKALEWHYSELRRCWLVCSEQSIELAKKFRNEIETDNKKVEIILVNDVFDVVEIRNKVDGIYRKLPPDFSESDVILDFTGMTSIASVGAFLACLNEDRPIQYTPGVFDTQLRAVQARDPVEVVLDWQVLQTQTKNVLPESNTDNLSRLGDSTISA